MFLKISQLCIKNFEKVGSEEEERQGGRWGGLRGRNIKAPDESLLLFPASAGKQVIIVVLENLLCGQS